MGRSVNIKEDGLHHSKKEFIRLQNNLFVRCLMEDPFHNDLTGKEMRLVGSMLSSRYGDTTKPEYVYEYRCDLCNRAISVIVKDYEID